MRESRAAEVNCEAGVLGREPLDDPSAVRRLAIADAIVQPRRAALPKLECLWRQAVTAPVRRARWTDAVAQAHLRDPGHERSLADRLALGRGPRADASAEWARVVVLVGLFRSGLLGHPVDPHLPLELGPVEQQARVRIELQLTAFPACVIRIEDEP